VSEKNEIDFVVQPENSLTTMDIVGLIKKSYRGYGTLLPDSLLQSARQNVSWSCCEIKNSFPQLFLFVFWCLLS